MDRDDYLKYIAYFIERIGWATSNTQYKSFFTKHLGKDGFEAPTNKIKGAAVHLYKAYVLSNIIKIDPSTLAFDLSSEQLTSFITDAKKLLEKYKVDISVPLYTTPAEIEKDMAKWAGMSKKGPFDLIYTPKKAPAKARAKPAPKKGTSQKKTPAKAKPAPKKSTPKKATSTKKAPVKKPAKKAKSTAECKKNYKLPELRELGKMMKVPGYSRMSKDELCQKLGL